LIEGAHAGAGLGDRFLRHVERTKLLLHLVDVSGAARDPIKDYQTVTHELEAYSPAVAAKPKIVLATKIDALDDPQRLDEFKEFCRDAGLEFHQISAATGSGLQELLYAVARKLESLTAADDTQAEHRAARAVSAARQRE
jgi:GTP-binding protein